MSTEELLFEKEDAIAVITLNRPRKLNAVTPGMAQAIEAAIEECDASADIRCLILTGAGDRAFCAGSDIATLDDYESPWQFRNRRDYCDAVRHCRKPVVAAINGYALGGGLETALATLTSPIARSPVRCTTETRSVPRRAAASPAIVRSSRSAIAR